MLRKLDSKLIAFIVADNENAIHHYLGKILQRAKRRIYANRKDDYWRAHIIHAAQKGCVNSVRALMQYDVYELGSGKGLELDVFTVLAQSLICKGCNDEAKVKLLFEILHCRRFKLNIPLFDAQRALSYLASNRVSHPLIAKLLDCGADPNLEFDGHYPLYYAVRDNNLSNIDVLLACESLSQEQIEEACSKAIRLNRLDAFKRIMNHQNASPLMNLGEWVTPVGRKRHSQPCDFTDLVAANIDNKDCQAMIKAWVTHPKYDLRQLNSPFLTKLSELAKKHNCEQLVRDVINIFYTSFTVSDDKPKKLIVNINELAIKRYILTPTHPAVQKIIQSGDDSIHDLLKEKDGEESDLSQLGTSLWRAKPDNTTSIYNNASVLYSSSNGIEESDATQVVNQSSRPNC